MAPVAVLIVRRRSLTGCTRRSEAINTLESTISPKRAVPEVHGARRYPFLYIARKVRIGYRRETQVCFKSLGNGDRFIKRPTRSLQRPDDSDWPVVVVDDHLGPVADLFQDRMEVARGFCFGGVNLRHTSNHRPLL